MTFEIEVGDGLLTFLLMLKSCQWVVVGGWVDLDYNVSSGPLLSFEIEIGDGPVPELDKYTIKLSSQIFFCFIDCSISNMTDLLLYTEFTIGH